jgi:ADP-heptose:LPS heptosyltransferase
LELLQGLLKKGYLVWLTGMGKTEESDNRSLIEAIVPSLQNNVISVANRFDLRSLAILISQSIVFIGPSTGPTHIANAVSTPLISFYPPIKVQSARRWGPYLAEGRIYSPNVPCAQKYHCIGEKCSHFFCMDSIQVEAVLAQLDSMVTP